MATAHELNQAELSATITRTIVRLEEFQTALANDADIFTAGFDALATLGPFTAAFGRWLASLPAEVAP